MFYFIKGTIEFIFDTFIVVNVHNIGYKIFVSDSSIYKRNDDVFLYVHTVIREDEEYLVGFPTQEERNVFKLLIKVKGLGPKTAIHMLKGVNPTTLINAIASNNIAYLKSLPGIGYKAASQILLDLHNQVSEGKGRPEIYEEVYQGLKALGFKGKAIDRVLASINVTDITSDELLKLALSKLRKTS